MQENYTVCNCKKVEYNDVINALENAKQFNDVLSAFEEVQKTTHCSTGCGGCHDKIVAIISDAMYGYESKPKEDNCKL